MAGCFLLLGGVLGWIACRVAEVWWPVVATVNEEKVAKVLFSRVREIEIKEEMGLADSRYTEKGEIRVCFDRAPESRADPSLALYHAVSYTRSFFPWWDPRGLLLDWRLPNAMVEPYRLGSTWVKTYVRLGFVEQYLTVLTNQVSTFSGGKLPALRPRFEPTCARAGAEGIPTMRVVAISPAILVPRTPSDLTGEEFGFFLAWQLEDDRGIVERRVDYVGVDIRRVKEEASDPVASFAEIPEKYWQKDFGTWPSIEELYEELIRKRRELD